jgi:4-diphosphocytidyl-2-C-methyl-D-erythritol kinase
VTAARVVAPAKVNLRLQVLGRRADGFHEIDTLFQAIDLADEVGVSLRGRGIRLDVRGADVGPVEENLAYRAAQRFAQEVGMTGSVAIELTKRVPAGAGLGGGSSDAAAVLRCLAKLAQTEIDDPRVMRAAEALGSDVPFFLGSSPLARGRGRGERLEALAPLPAADLVLVSPPVHVSTAEAYAALAAARSGKANESKGPVPSPRSWEDVAASASNDFESVIAARHQEVRRALGALASAGATFSLMTGSGSSVFGWFPGQEAARGAAEELGRHLGWPCRAVRTLGTLPEPQVT